MMKNSIAAACASVLLASVAGLATPTASHAAIYGGVYDPENANYKWFGNHVFTVDDACLVGDGWKQVNTEYGYGGCGNASLTSGDLTVVNKLGTLSVSDDVSKTLQFTDFGFIPSSAVWGVNIVGGQLVGVDTFEIGNFVFADPGTTHAGNWQLRWTSGNGAFCALYGGCGRDAGDGTFSSFDANPRGGTGPDVVLTNSLLGPTALPQGATVSFQRLDVPEPSTVTLVLAALGAGWLTRRRGKR